MKLRTRQSRAAVGEINSNPNPQAREAGRPAGRDIILAAALGLLTLTGLFAFQGRRGFDDPYITFRYARNLLDGRGLVYNPGERSLATTAPLYAILLAGLGVLTPDLPAAGRAVSGLALVGSAAVLLAWGRAEGRRSTGLIAGLLLTMSPDLLLTFGAETCLYVLLVLVGLYASGRSRLTPAAAALALAAMIRPDGLLAAVAAGACHLARRRPVRLRPVLLFAGLAGAFYAGLWLYFGSPIPMTLFAKQQQAQIAVARPFLAGFVDLLGERSQSASFYWLAALAVAGLVQVVRRERHWTPLLVWTALYFLAYTVLGVSSYFWYYAPLVPAGAVLVAEGLTCGIRWLGCRLPAATARAAAAVLLVATVAPVLSDALSASWYADPRLGLYREIGEWLEGHSPPEASVGALEVGVIGYYSQRRMIDFAGLLQADVARRLAPGGSFGETAAWAIQSYRPDYVVVNRPGLPGLLTSDWFHADYLPVREFSNEEALWWTLYHRRDGL